MPADASHPEWFLIRVVSFQEGQWLVAQCLEVDIAAQARTEDELLYQLSRLLVGRVMAADEFGVDPFHGLPPAPKKYWDMFSEATSPPAKVVPFIPIRGKTNARSLPTLEVKKAA